MTDLTHLNALQLRLSHERDRKAAAMTVGEVELRTVWIAQIEREIADELAFLGLDTLPGTDISDDDLLAELGL